MRKTTLLVLGLFLALNLPAQDPFTQLLNGLPKEQKRAFGMMVADTVKMWENGYPTPYEAPSDFLGQLFGTAHLEVFPAQNPNGLCVVMCPGGGYAAESQSYEGRDLAGWFNARGITYCMLQYRLPGGKYTEAPLQDALEAVRIMKGRKDLGITKVGIAGCSAGGHLATTAATHYTADSRPDFQILFYPVVTMDPSYTHMGSHDNLLGANPGLEKEILYSNEKQVTSDTPPAFIMGSTDDDTVPVPNFVNYYLSLLEKGVKGSSLHLYPSGGHGWGNKDTFIYKGEWESELERWIDEVVKK